MPELEDLLLKLESKDVDTVKKTLEALGELGNVNAVPSLVKMLDKVTDEDILESVLWTLSRIADNKTLVKLLKYANETIIIEILDALGRREARDSVDEILPFLSHQNGEVRAIAMWALGKIHAEKTYKTLLNKLKADEDPLVRANAAWAIGKFENLNAIHILTELLEQEIDECVLYNLEEAIEHLQEAKDPLQRGLKVTVYECPERESNCLKKTVRTETILDQFIKIEIKCCDVCPIAKICQVELIKRIKN